MLIDAGRLRSGQDLVQSAACHQVPLRPNLSSAGTPTGSFFHQRCVQVAIYGAGQQLHTAGMVPHISYVKMCLILPKIQHHGDEPQGGSKNWCQHIRKIGDWSNVIPVL